MLCSVSRIIFIILVITIALIHPQYASNSRQNQLGQSRQMRKADLSCTVDDDCGKYGYCQKNVCQCSDGYITWKTSYICAYKQREQLAAFFISFFFGTLGCDWFMLSRGNGGYIAVGVVKLFISLGGCVGQYARRDPKTFGFCAFLIGSLCAAGGSIWWLVDWIRIIAGDFPDGNGAPLKSW